MRRSLVWSLVFIIGGGAALLAGTVLSGSKLLLGLDLKGGVSVVLKPQGTANKQQLQQAVNIIERRVNGLGVANSNVERQGSDVVINLPGIKDAQGALRVLGTTAELYFRPVLCEIPAYAPTPGAGATTPATTTPATTTPKTTVPGSTTVPTKKTVGNAVRATLDAFVRAGATSPTTAPVSSTTLVPQASQSDCSLTTASAVPTTPPGQDTQTATVVLPASNNSGYGNIRFILGAADMTGRQVKNAFVALNSAGQYAVELSFTSSGSTKFDQVAAQRYVYFNKNATSPDFRNLEAIELDGLVESAPQIEQSTFNGQAEITGQFSSSQASNLALELKYGSLPVRFTPQSIQTVSATIGKDSLHAGLYAGLGGIVLVLLYMIMYYRMLGLVVLLGLCVGGAFLYSILTLLSQNARLALTLAGVTGIIVSVGITVDSYVVYFERLKDEVRAGRTIRQSVERGFARAFRTVLTADLVSFLAALILYLLTVGDVRGFAFTLGLSTLLDVFTAYFFIRPMVIMVGRRRAFTDARILGVARGLGATGSV